MCFYDLEDQELDAKEYKRIFKAMAEVIQYYKDGHYTAVQAMDKTIEVIYPYYE